MEDVTPEILEAIREEFQNAYDSSDSVARIIQKVSSGSATYKDANDYAIIVGDMLANAYKNNLTSDILPDGKMYYNIASRIIEPTMTNNYNIVSDLTAQIQQRLNEKSNIGINAITPKMNKDRIDGIINKVSNAENFDEVAWALDEPVKNFTQNIVDESIRQNSEFQGQAGLQPKIVRKLAGGCCEWCAALAGTYTYPDVPKDVYRRHRFCRCTVEYDPGTGKVQNVHTKGWTNPDLDLERLKTMGIEETPKVHIERGIDVTKEYMNNRFPGQGQIKFQENYNKEKHHNEIKIAQWLHDYLGGDITLLTESKVNGIKMPDYIWRGKNWELKTTTTEKSTNSAVRKGLKQIDVNSGGIILNYKNNDIDINSVASMLDIRMKVSQRDGTTVDILIILDDKLQAVIRYKK